MKYSRYHAAGNDYIVIDPDDVEKELGRDAIRLICHRNYGVGSDGILCGPLENTTDDFGLKIYNPDGSEAEKSGNGLRIFSRYLWDKGLVTSTPFTVWTAGGTVVCKVGAGGRSVKVEMGNVSFDSRIIPVAGTQREVLEEEMKIDGDVLRYCAATIGNPHCVVLMEKPTAEKANHYGPLIETESRFPNRTNVQFMEIVDRRNIKIEIWERGAGYTLASGSSSTAAAAVAFRLGLCDEDIWVHMPGGEIKIEFGKNFSATMTGPVTKICNGSIAQEMFDHSL